MYYYILLDILLGFGIMLIFCSSFSIYISIVRRKIGLFKYSLPLFIAGILIATGSTKSKDIPTANPKLIILGVIIVAIDIIVYLNRNNLLKLKINQKKPDNNYNIKRERCKITSDNLIPMFKRYYEKKKELLEQYKNDENFAILKDALDKLPGAYNSYAVELLGTTKLSKKPIDPIVATALGNSIGGIPGGVAMGLSAYEKKNKWKEELKSFDAEYRNIKNKENRVLFLLNTIDEIIYRADN